MNNFEFELHGRTYKRVPKNIARKIHLVEPDELINPDFAEPGTYRREVDDLHRHVRQSTKA